MKRKLLRQTLNEWRTNIWLIVEMIIVSAIVWYINDYLYVQTATRLEPTGFDASHVYMVELGHLSPESPRYTDYGEEKLERNRSDLRVILDAIRQRPEVESVSLSQGAEPYFQNFWGTGLKVVDDTTSISVYYRQISPEHPRTVGYRPADGFTIEQLEEVLRQGKPLVTEFDYGSRGVRGHINSTELLSRRIYDPMDTAVTLTIGGLLKPVKRTDIETRSFISYFEPIDIDHIGVTPQYKLNVRVRFVGSGREAEPRAALPLGQHLYSRHQILRAGTGQIRQGEHGHHTQVCGRNGVHAHKRIPRPAGHILVPHTAAHF